MEAVTAMCSRVTTRTAMVRLIDLRFVSFRDGARRSVGSAARRPGLLDDMCAVAPGELAPS